MGRIVVESEQTYRALTPTQLTALNGLSFLNGDSYAISKGSNVGESTLVCEAIDPNNGTIEIWCYPYNYGNAGQRRVLYDAYVDVNNRIILYINSSNNLTFDIIGNGTTRTASTSFASIKPFTWNHILATWSKNATVNGSNYSYIYLNGSGAGQTSAVVAMTSVPSLFYIGSDYNGLNSANGLIAYKIMRYWTSSTQVTSYYNSGNGSTEFITRTPHTIAMGLTGENSTGVAFVHRGATVSAIADGATEDTLTVATDATKRFADNDVVVAQDGRGYSSQRIAKSYVDGAPSATSMDVDDGAGADVGGIENIGIRATISGGQYFQKVSPANIGLADDYTISAWIKTSSASNQMVYWKDGASDYGLAIFVNPTGTLTIRLYQNSGSHTYSALYSIATVIDGKWHHIAVTYDDAPTPTLAVYIDGFLDNSTTSITGTKDGGAGSITIGTGFGYNFTGSIADVMVWTSLLTSANILTLASNPHSESALSPASWWVFDDAGSATTIADQASAGNNNHLTLYGGDTTNYGTHSRTQAGFVSRNQFVDGDMRNGGIGSLSRISGATVSKNTTTPIADEQDLKLVNSGAAQGYAGQSIPTTAGDNLYFYGLAKLVGIPSLASELVNIDADASKSITVKNIDDLNILGPYLNCAGTYNAYAGDNGVLDLTTGNISVSCKAYIPSGDNYQAMVIKNGGAAGYGLMLYNGTLRGFIHDGTDSYNLYSANFSFANGWHWFAMVFNRASASDCKLYIDGVDVTSSRVGTLANVDSCTIATPFRLGKRNDAGYELNGSICEVRIGVNQEWTQAQIQAQMAGTGSMGTITEYYSCRKGSGTTVYATVTATTNDLTLSSASAWENNVREVEFCFDAGDTSTDVDLGSGSATSADIGYWDNVKLMTNFVDNPGMEGGADPPTSWVQETNATVTSDTSPHAGTNCLKVVAGADNVGASQAITLVSGQYYTIIGYCKATLGDSARIIADTGDGILLTVGTVTATTWARVRISFKATGASGNVYLRGVANTDVVWFDDIAIVRDDTGSVTATKGAGIIPINQPLLLR